MLTVTPLGPYALRVAGGSRSLSIYPPKAAQSGDLTLLGAPEEEPRANTLSWPGEYDIGGVMLRGIGHAEGQEVSWLAVVDGVRCAFPSSPLKDWTDPEIELLGDVDVLALPGDDPKLVQKLIEEVDPRVLIVMPGKDGKTRDEVLKICGAQGKEAVSEHKVKSALPAEGREVVVFSVK